jgi:hypothetical protein
MLLKAEFQLDLDVDNYVDAARHQRAVEAFVAEMRGDYPQVQAAMRACRKRSAATAERSSGHG